MGIFAPDRSYLVCCTQRTGSQLLCTLLQDTEVVGCPPVHELFKASVNEEWSPDSFSADLDLYLRRATGRNGLTGCRMFSNGWELFLERSRAARELGDVDDLKVLSEIFGELQFVWLRRLDKLRQAISFWRATTGGDQFRYPTDGRPVNVPKFDFDRISRFIQLDNEREGIWTDWFDRNGITPKQVAYEDLITGRERVIREVLGYLGVENSENVAVPEPRVRQQADEHTERYILLYEEERTRRCG